MRRFRVSLRLMFLVVALFAVLFAWLGARRELRRTDLRGELGRIELWREFALNHPDVYTSEQAWRSDLTRLDALVAERRESLGERDQ